MEILPDYITEIFCQSSSFQSFQKYSLRLQHLFLNSEFKLNLIKPNNIEPYYWEAIIALNSLQKEYKCLFIFEKDKEFYDFMVQCFEAKTVILSESSNNIMKLTFPVTLNQVKTEISLVLNKKTKDITEKVNHISNHVKNSDERFERFKMEMQTKLILLNQEFSDYKEKTEKELREMMQLINGFQPKKSVMSQS